jgi:hypothetical protein
MRIVLIAVVERGREQDHRVVQHGSLAFLHVAQFAQQISILFDVPAIDHSILPQFLGIVGVVRDFVMRVRHAFEKTEVDATDGVAKHERADTRCVALKGERDHIQHEAHVLLMRRRILQRLASRVEGHKRLPGTFGIAGPLHPRLERPYDLEILIHAVLVAGAELGSHPLRLFEHAVEQEGVLFSPNHPRGTPPETGARTPTAGLSPAPAESSGRSTRYGSRTRVYIRRSHPRPSIRARCLIRAMAAGSRRRPSAPLPDPSKVRGC